MVMGGHGCKYDALKPKTDDNDHEWLNCSSLLGEVCQVFAIKSLLDWSSHLGLTPTLAMTKSLDSITAARLQVNLIDLHSVGVWRWLYKFKVSFAKSLQPHSLIWFRGSECASDMNICSDLFYVLRASQRHHVSD